MKYLSVCSGIEAASVAWHPLGFEPVGFSEIEKFPAAVLRARFPHVQNFGDMNGFESWDLEAIDILVGGTPCQSFSVAGLRKGMADSRGNLALVYCRILDRFRPKWFVWENVPGVLSSGRGRDFGSFLGAVAKLGYGFAYRVLDAQWFGVPQRRRRVFVVGCLGDWRRSAAVLFERESLSRNSAKGPSSKQEIARTLRGRAQSSHRDDSESFIPVKARTLSARYDGSPCIDRGPEFIAKTVLAGGHSNNPIDENLVAFSCKDYAADAGPVSPTLRSMGHDGTGGQVAIAFNARQDPDAWENRTGPLDTDGCTQAIAIGSRARGDDGRGYAGVSTLSGLVASTVPAIGPRCSGRAMQVRRLTPRECERLQGFPDDWTAIEYRGKPACDGPRYKAIGNSMAVPVMRWIGERLSAAI